MYNKRKISILVVGIIFASSFQTNLDATQISSSNQQTEGIKQMNMFKVPIKSGVVTNEFGGYDALGTGHTGIDLANTTGTPVYAAQSGTVITSSANDVSGNKVEVLHYLNGHYYVTYYGHLDSRSVKVGDKVSTSTELGKMGETGLATGPHVHFEIMENTTVSNHNLSIDPRKYLTLPEVNSNFVENDSKIEYDNINGFVTRGYKYSESKLTNVYEYYPSTKNDGNQSNHVKFEFLLDGNQNIISATKYADGTNQIISHYKYYPATKYESSGTHGKHIKYRYDVNADGYLTRAYKFIDGTNQKEKKYWYQTETIYENHANRIVKTYYY